MEKNMLNITGNLVRDPDFRTITTKNGDEMVVANFTLVRDSETGKEYTNCAAYGEKSELAKDFYRGDMVHVFGYISEKKKDNKIYKNFIIQDYNKVEKREEN